MDKAAQGGHNTTHDAHWMGILLKSFVKVQNLLMDEHFILNSIIELEQLLRRRLVAIEKDKANLNVGAILD